MAEHRLFLRGEIDLASSPQLSASLAEALACGDVDVLLDCSQMTFIDSTGIHAIEDANRLLEARGRHMLVVNVSSITRQMFDFLGLTELLHVERGLISN